VENRMAVKEKRLSELMDWSSALKVKGEIKQRQANKLKLRHLQIESLIRMLKGEKSVPSSSR
jgi:Holliday junction resolvase